MNVRIFLVLAVLIFGLSSAFTPTQYSGCERKDFGHGSVVCVCSEEKCGQFQSKGEEPLKTGQFAVYTSSKDGLRFNLSTGLLSTSWSENTDDVVTLNINASIRYQEILGFGGAFTDAATMNILNMSTTLQQKLIQSYYSAAGIQYSIGRIPMASCDFSTREYSYDDYPEDFALKNFSLVEEDLKFKIPVIMSAINESVETEILFFGSPWSAPAWMKTSGKMSGAGKLKGKAGDNYHKTWAMYFAKFISSYTSHGIPIWGVTVQNEPSTGFIPNYSFQTMGFTAEEERDFIKEDLGPTLAQAGYSDLKVMMLDDQRIFLDNWVDVILSDPIASKFVSGIGLHWYWDWLASADDLTIAHNKFPHHFMLATEACTGYTNMAPPRGVVLGDWSRGEHYAHSIIEDLSHWVVGWVDWNLALNLNGGPNWVNNVVDSPIIVDSNSHVFYKQPMYYHLGHFSKFVPRGSKRISIQSPVKTALEYIAFITPDPDAAVVVVVLNKGHTPSQLNLVDPNRGHIAATIPASAIQTYVWTV